MFVKLFDSIYDGTLAENWRALVTFQQLLILCDAKGVIDMTPPAIARRTGIPIDIIQAGIEALEAEDPHSRTPAEGGRRIVRLAEHRDWGWRVVNFVNYRQIRTSDDRREYMRNYMRERRQKQQATGRAEEKNPQNQSPSKQPELTKVYGKPVLARLAHTEEDAEEEKKICPKPKNGSGPVVARLELVGGQEFEINQHDVDGWSEAFPAVDVLLELKRMREWGKANPNKRKTAKGVRRFVTSWLGRVQDRGGLHRGNGQAPSMFGGAL